MTTNLRYSQQNIITQNITNSLIYYQNLPQTQKQNNFSKKIDLTYQYPTQKYFLTLTAPSEKNQFDLDNYKNFYFSAFDISHIKNHSFQQQSNNFGCPITQSILFKKPQPFMGAFIQTQTQLQFFDLNIKIPKLSQNHPFSRILSDKKFPQKQQKIGKVLNQSLFESQYNDNLNQLQSQNANQNDKNIKNQLQILQLSKIQPYQQQNSTIYPNPIQQYFLNYNQQLSEKQHQLFIKSFSWDNYQSNLINTFNFTYQFYKDNSHLFIQSLQNKMLISENTIKFNNQQICQNITKMILGIQNDLFTLNYHTLQWSFNASPAKFEYILRTSFPHYLQDLFYIATHKSKIQAALLCINKQLHRWILKQLSIQIKQFLLIVQQIILQNILRKSSLLDFCISIQQIKSQIFLIYQLLINQNYIHNQNKSFMDFNHLFLNSQTAIFKQIIRISNANDSTIGKNSQFSLKLLRACFKPITFALSRVAFQQVSQISNKDDTYLRYYYSNVKDLLQYLGKRIDLIKQQSNQLYMICRIKSDIKLIRGIEQLNEYTKIWKQIFITKKKMIDEVHKRYKKKLKQQKQKQQQQKIKQIYQLKAKLLKSIQQNKQKKSKIYLQNLKQIQQLKKDIMQRQQRRKLNYLIQKQQEKGFLLDAELRQKTKLIHQRDQLLIEAEKEGIHIEGQNLKKVQNVEQPKKIDQKKQQMTIKSQKIVQQNKQLLQTPTHKTQPIIQQKPKQISIKADQKQQLQQHPSTISIQRVSIQIPSSHKVQQQLYSQQQLQQNHHSQLYQHSNQPKQQKQPIEQSTIDVSTNTVLQLCIDNIVRQQIQIVHQALSYLVYDQYQLLNLMQFMRKIFLSGNGEAVTNFLHLSVSSDSKINIQYFSQCSLFDSGDDFIRNLQPSFYQMYGISSIIHQNELKPKTGIHQNRQVNLFQQSLEVSVGFQFLKLPVLLQPYFSYIHLSKYMQIFSQILKIKHCGDLIYQCFISMNQCKKQLLKDDQNKIFLQKLFATRHVIHIYLNTLQSFLYYRIIEKQTKNIRKRLLKKQINQLSILHLNMLDNIIQKGLIENQVNDISQKTKNLLMEIRKFKNIVDSFCANDIHSYVRGEIESQVKTMHRVFRQRQKFIQSLFYHY